MTDDDLDRCRVEMYRRVEVLIETRRALAAAKASGKPDAIALAEGVAWQAGLALAESAINDMARVRMQREIEHLDHEDDDPATNHRRGLIMLVRFLTDMRPFGRPDVTDVAAGDIFRQLNGVQGQLLHPVVTGRGPKGFNDVDRNLIRRYVLRVFVECARTGKTQGQFLNSLPKSPTLARFRGWSQLKDDRQERLVPLKDQQMATAIGKVLSAGQPLSNDQRPLWDEIKHDDLVVIHGFLQRY
jgi:hypothetical protein